VPLRYTVAGGALSVCLGLWLAFTLRRRMRELAPLPTLEAIDFAYGR
jgi:hypothetical protein